jgi:hypothetical protein
MKKNFFFAAALLGLMASCGGPGAEVYDKAAQDMCDCVTKKRAEADPDDFLNTDDIHFAFCALDVAVDHGVSAADDDFAKSLNSKCADLNALQKEYKKNAEQQ